jgi:UDP-2-acetamido-3-amino-2,3-dideoxy-glucuronate N-acetyltransferase
VFDDVRPWEQKLEWFDNYTGVVDARKSRGVLAEPRFVEVRHGEPLLAECRHFVECCRERREPITSGGEAERVITVLDAAQRSLDGGGGPVAIASL